MPKTIEPSFRNVDYKNNDNITLNIDTETGVITGYTTFGGITDEDDPRSFYFENASILLPDNFFKDYDADRFVLLKEPYEVRENPEYGEIVKRREEEQRKREEQQQVETVSREEYDKLAKELEELKKLILGKGESK
ncbi:tail fiber protein [Staphylococcus phage phiSA_BS1]|uniref:Uncharacterized protein n=2 Tax=Baoshanvirus TaxID=2732969 RepID=A0A2P1MXJ2_9CAUD|nr:tail fiber protein [Staphylococcus phage phiSA_BS1]YP_009799957.1 tail fiber protein [Staphylococcus phage phiSA_BS2]AVP40294.1 hypothetical protein [Staphylococcus phage phiSA_BS1]AVR55561.1 hypothetical protein phiSABS2_117 [Staphylococcus phage phiSA_BS2]